MKFALTLLVIAPALAIAQQAADVGFKPVSLQEALTMAQQNAPSAVQSLGAIENAEGTLRTTRNQLFPTLTGGLSHSQGAGDRLDQNTGRLVSFSSQPQYATSLNASYTLFDGGRRVNDIRARRADLVAAEVSQSATQFNISLQVKQQYFAILAAREAESAARLALDVARQQLDASTTRVRAGAAIISDSLRAFVAFGNARLAVITAQNTLRNASLSLTRLAGSETLITATAGDTSAFAIVPVDSAAVVTLAITAPAVRQAEASLVASSAAVKSAKAAYYPSLSTSLRYGGSGNDKFYGVGGDKLAYSNNFSLNLSMPIWDGGNRQEAVRRAQITVDNGAVAVRDARLLAQQNILLQLSTLRTAEERIRVQQSSVQAAEEDLRVQQLRYTLGSSTQLEVATSQNALNAARQALIQARLDYRIARAQIEAIIGRDLQ